MHKKRLFPIISICLCLSLFLAGCSNLSSHTKDLTKGYKSKNIDTLSEMESTSPDVADFGVRLFQHSITNHKNTLISPISVLCALTMTANGANTDTLSQMEEVFGLSTQDLNNYLHTYMSQLPDNKNNKLHIANSIWVPDDDRVSIAEDFLQTNVNYFDAEIYESAFDEHTMEDINSWVNKHTDGMIPEIIDRISQDAIMYLVNALAFEAEWEEVYTANQVHERVFTLEDGTETDVEMMYSDEYAYLEDENATGFIKYYKDREYAFVALLPNEGTTVAEYVSTLTGDNLHKLLTNPISTEVNAAIPKFEDEYSVEMNSILENMGMTDAFDSNLADFSRMGQSADNNFFINRVLHKTFISVYEEGTKAGAATVVEMAEGAAMSEPKVVHLNRPFVYMLIDCENSLPLFMGTMMNVNE